MRESKSSLNPLHAYTYNLTAHARTGLLPRHPEYSAEAARVIQILARRHDSGSRQRHRSNPVLLDVDGLERWPAIQETVAILAEDGISAHLHGFTILALDYEALMVGVDASALVQEYRAITDRYPRWYPGEGLTHDAALRGTFRRHMRESQEWRDHNVAYQRLRSLLLAISSSDSPTILFVDHLHRLLGGDWAHYPFDMAPLLKRLLGLREIQLWGACTLAEYRGTIERDAAMQRHFVEVCLPSACALLAEG